MNRIPIVLGAALLLPASEAAAHGFGQRYDLPVPLWLFIVGGAAAVAFSFIVAGLFLRGVPDSAVYPRYNLLRLWPFRLLAHPALLWTVKAFFAALFVLILVTGLFGAQNPRTNLIVVVVWVIAWVGLAYMCALLGDIWALINPWKNLFAAAEWLAARLKPGGKLSAETTYPAGLGVIPGIVLFVIFAWLEIVWEGASAPRNLATVLIVYSAITWIGMATFGRETWLRHGEVFSIIFGLFGRFAITEARRDAHGERQWNLRPPAIGLFTDQPPSTSLMVFVLVVLSTVSFDGFVDTAAWQRLGYAIYQQVKGAGDLAIPIIGVAGILGAPALFVAAYLIVIALIGVVSDSLRDFPTLARIFVLSIVPIAVAYHLSHYASMLAIEGQLLIPEISDPFGWGWDLFGTRDYRVDIAIVGAREIWFFSVAAIVIGHIAAVYLAHAEAMRFHGRAGRALMSQIPMLILMVGYTMVSLWIIAQPIVT
jgi:hypothetical protein